MDQPTHSYKYWTKSQEEHLLLRIQEDMDLDEIAKIHLRSVSALKGRLGKIAFDLFSKGEEMAAIQTITKLSPDDVQLAIKSHQTKKKRLTVSQKLDKILDLLHGD